MKVSTESILIVTESVKYSLCSDVIMTFFVKIASVDELKQRICDEWHKIDHQLIDSAIKQWHKCLATGVSAQSGHIEHML